MKSAAPLVLGSKRLTIEDVGSVAAGARKVKLSSKAIQAIRRSHEFIRSELASGKTIYGLNTGFGPLSDVKIAPSEIEKLQYNFLRSHAAGVGEPLADRYVRGMLLLR